MTAAPGEMDVAAAAGNAAATSPAPTRDGWTTTPELDQLTAALVDALGELQDVPRTRTANAGTYKYAYADLSDAFALVRPVFNKHGLAMQHDCYTDDGDVVARAVIRHKSGQCLAGSPLRLPAGNAAQNHGSAMTYARRYTLMAICGLATEDDDGATAGTRDEQTMTVKQVDQFIDAATQALLTKDEIAQVVLAATQGRTMDPKQVYRSEIQMLRDALAARTRGSGGDGPPVDLPPAGEGGSDRPTPPSPELPLQPGDVT